jgi:transmembrane protein 132
LVRNLSDLFQVHLFFFLSLTSSASFLFAGASLALDLHLEGADAGFFFQQSLGSSQQPLLKFPTHSYSSNASSADPPPLLRERLAVLGPSAQPGRILVTYGPFEAKQSLPTKYLTLPLENATEGGGGNEQATLMDVTAHVVNNELRRESPVLRVLFHSGRHFHSPGQIEVPLLLLLKNGRTSLTAV